MKLTRKIIAFLMVCMMVLGLSVTAFAVDSGKGGPASITIANAAPGETYTIYHIFDATVSSSGAIAYKLPAGKSITGNAANWFEVKDGGYVTATAQLNVKSTEFQNWAKSFGTNVFSKTVTATDLTNGKMVVENLPYGYYLITTTLGALVTVNSTNPSVEVIDKNDSPSWDDLGKVIVKSDGSEVTANTTKLEEEIVFDIGITAKNYDGTDKIFKYEVEDRMAAGMTFLSNLTVKVGNTEINPTIAWYKNDAMTQAATGYNDPEAKAFKITIPWTDNGKSNGNSLYANGSEIHIRYTAKLDSAKVTAIGNKVLFDVANGNKSIFKWYAGPGGDNPNDPTTPKGTAPEKKTETYITQITVRKTDGTNVLTGAEFTLTGPSGTLVFTQGYEYVADASGAYWKLKDGTYTTTNPNGANVNQNAYESITQRYRQQTYANMQGANQTSTEMKAFVNNAGFVVFSGLVPGTYTLSESVVPSGYNKAADIEFVVSFDTANKTWSVTDNDNNASTTTPVTMSGNVFNVTIENRQGTEMPETGGIGTTIFYIVGAILLVGAGVVLVARRRVHNREQ